MAIIFLFGNVTNVFMENITNTRLAFNGAVIGTILLGDFIWCRVKNRLMRHWEEKDRSS